MKHLKRFIATLAITVLPFHSYVNGCGGDFYDYMNYYKASSREQRPATFPPDDR